MKFTKATVVVGNGADQVILKTDLPTSIICFPNESLHLKFEATKGTGEAYVREHFQIEPEVIKRA